MTLEVFVNGVGWVEVPDENPGFPLYSGWEWTVEHETILRALLPRYSVERIAWTLGRRVPAVRHRMDYLGINRPHVDEPGRCDVLGRVA